MQRIPAFILGFVLITGVLMACDQLPWLKPEVLTTDLQAAQRATRDGEWTRAQRYLERYLRAEENPDLRWSAWQLLLDGAVRSDPSGGWAVDYLETMALEYEDETERVRDVLRRLAGLHETMGRTDSAVSVWERYCTLPGLDDAEYAGIQQRMARMFLRQGKFEAADDSLRICVALAEDQPRQAECLFDLASMAAMRDDVSTASDLAGQVLGLEGADTVIKARAGFILADILEVQGKSKEALALFKEIRDDYPNEMVVDYRIQALSKKK